MAATETWQPPEVSNWQPPETVTVDEKPRDLAPMFGGLDKVLGAMDPLDAQHTTAYLNSVPEASKPEETAAIANLRFLTDAYKGHRTQDELNTNLDFYRNEYATSMGWLKPSDKPLDNSGFYARVGKFYKGTQAKAQEISQAVMEDVLAGENWRTTTGRFLREHRNDPDFEPSQLETFSNVARQTAEGLKAKAETLGPVVSQLSQIFTRQLTDQEASTETLEDAAKLLLTLDPKDRQLAADLAAIHTAKNSGGTGDEADAHGIVGKTAKAFSQGTMQLVDAIGAPFADEMQATMMLRRSFDSIADPVESKNMMGRVYYGLIHSGETLAMTVAAPWAAIPLLAGANYQQRITRGEGAPASAAGAAIDTAMNFVGGNVVFKGGFGAVEAATLQTVRSNAIKRLGADVLALGGMAVLDQTIPPIIQHYAAQLDASGATKQVKFEALWDNLKGASAETALSVVVMSLIGTGVGGVKDVGRWREATARTTMWEAAGWGKEQAARIAAAPTIEERLALAQSMAPKGREATQKAAIATLDAEVTTARETAQTLPDGQPAAEVKQDSAGVYVVTSGEGEEIGHASTPEAAMEIKVEADQNSYQGAHKPMTTEGGAARLHDLAVAFGEDIYTKNAIKFFGSGDPREKQTVKIMNAVKGNPDDEVTIYRGIKDGAGNQINSGDWVTLLKSVADEYAGDGGVVIEKTVKAKDITSWPDSLLEFGYFPEKSGEAPKMAQRPGIPKEDAQPAPVAEPNPEPNVTGTSRAELNKVLKAQGMEELSESGYEAQKDTLKNALDAVAAEPGMADRLVNEIEAGVTDGKPKLLNATERTVLGLEARRLSNAREENAARQAELEALPQTPETESELDALREHAMQEQAEFDRFSEASREAGEHGARSLAAMGVLLKQDYSLAGITRRVREAQGGKPLSEEQTAQVAELTKQLRDLQGQFNALKAGQAEAAIASRTRAPANRATNRLRAYLKAEADAAWAELQKKTGQLNAGIDVTMIPLIAKIGAHYLAEGIAHTGEKLGEWGRAMRERFGETIEPHLGAILEQAQEVRARAAIDTRLAQLDALIAKYEQQIKTADVMPKGRETPESPEITAREAKLEELRSEKEKLRDELTPPDVKNAKAVEAYKKRVEARISDIEARTAAADADEQPAAKPEKTPLQLDEKAAALTAKMDLAKRNLDAAVEGARVRAMTPAQRARYELAGVYDSARSIMTGFESSFVLRQGAFFAGRPVKMLKAFASSLRALAANQDKAHQINNEVLNHPDADRAQSDGLYLADDISTSLSRQEEHAMGRWVGKIPLLGRFNRAGIVFLNKLRLDVFRSLTDGRTMNPEERHQIAIFVNEATGRGGLGGMEKHAVVLNRIMFSARFRASRIQLLLGHSMWQGSAKTRIIIAAEYARALVALGTFYVIAKQIMGDDKHEATISTDPTSPDFAKIRVGNTRLDPLAGLAQQMVFASRTITAAAAAYKRERNLPLTQREQEAGDTYLKEAIRYGRNSLHPIIGKTANVMFGKATTGEKTTALKEIYSSLYPMTYEDIAQMLKEQHGMDDETVFATMAFFGMGLQTYQAKKK